jgi:hypothetical protein
MIRGPFYLSFLAVLMYYMMPFMPPVMDHLGAYGTIAKYGQQ